MASAGWRVGGWADGEEADHCSSFLYKFSPQVSVQIQGSAMMRGTS